MDSKMKAAMDAEEARDAREGIRLVSSADSTRQRVLKAKEQEAQMHPRAAQSPTISTKPDTKEHLLILYNPYYNAEVIEQHWQVLKDNGKVAFGKIKSKLRTSNTSSKDSAIQNKIAQDATQNSTDSPQTIAQDDNTESAAHPLARFIETTSPSNPLQLFLSDYANLYVCKVIEISQVCNAPAPSYYKEQDIEVELWFMISDMRELVRNDFKAIRDYYLAYFITSHNRHTFALYGNDYSYPLAIYTKREMNFFDSLNLSGEEGLHYPNMFKNAAFIQVREHFINYVFGENLLMKLKPDCADNLINAEIEYLANKDNAMHDCTGIIMLYGKSMEQEIARFVRTLLNVLITFEIQFFRHSSLTTHCLKPQVKLTEWLNDEVKLIPNLESYKQLLILNKVKKIFTQWQQESQNLAISSTEKLWIETFSTKTLPHFITSLQKVRNPAAHESKAHIRDIAPLRRQILGVGCEGVLTSLLLILERLETLSIQNT